jgi:DNA phosphorothioation-dependent restriction protein DptG
MVLNEELIDKIGEYIGFEMWNNRDKTKEYTLNLITMKPTKNSNIQKCLSTELCEKIKNDF